MRHSLTRAGILAGAILAGTLLPLLPTASASAGTCTYEYFCAWDLDGWDDDGAKRSWKGNNNNYANSGFDDRAESIRNNGAPAYYDVVWFYDKPYYNAADGRGCIRRGESIELGYWNWDNQISSHAWHSACPGD